MVQRVLFKTNPNSFVVCMLYNFSHFLQRRILSVSQTKFSTEYLEKRLVERIYFKKSFWSYIALLWVVMLENSTRYMIYPSTDRTISH